MRKIMFCIVTGILVSIISVVYTDSVMADLSDNLVRLHIIANSDSDCDQAVKYKVRDEIIKYAQTNGVPDLHTVTEIADNTLRQSGMSYNASAQYGNFQFPKKIYDNITLPQGWYYGVKVVLGDGAGQNWWCVMYPPLCFTEQTTGELSDEGKAQLSSELNAESYEMITDNDDVTIEVKFKVVEMVQKMLKR